MDEVPVLDQISGCSDVGFSVYFICLPASSSSQNKAPCLSLLSSPSLLWQDKIPLTELARFILPGNCLELWSPVEHLPRRDNYVGKPGYQKMDVSYEVGTTIVGLESQLKI